MSPYRFFAPEQAAGESCLLFYSQLTPTNNAHGVGSYDSTIPYHNVKKRGKRTRRIIKKEPLTPKGSYIFDRCFLLQGVVGETGRPNQENDSNDDGTRQSVLDLQQRADELEILIGFLRQKILRLQDLNIQQLHQTAAALAECRRLKSHIESLKHGSHGHQSTSAVIAGACRFLESQELDDEIEDDEEESLSSDDSVYEIVSKEPKTRKLTNGNPIKNAKKAKLDQSSTEEFWSTDSEDYYIYSCPVGGCDKKLWLHKKHNPTINAKGEISDQDPWIGNHFNKKIRKMREHMKRVHPDWKESDWPPGFAKRDRHGKKDNGHTLAPAPHPASQGDQRGA
eukprot:scaffold2633_cov156-Amphora_coffeaeformis.AAC.19